MRKSKIGKLYTFKFPKRKRDIRGVVIDFNAEWTLILRVIAYTVDGFTIFKNEKVETLYGDFERFASRILKLKNYSHLKQPKAPIDSLENIFVYLDNNYGLIQIDMLDGEASDVVKYLGHKNGVYFFRELTPRAKWRYKLEI